MFGVERLAVGTASAASAIHKRMQLAGVPQPQSMTDLVRQDPHESAAVGFIAAGACAIDDGQGTGTDASDWGNCRINGARIPQNDVIATRCGLDEL